MDALPLRTGFQKFLHFFVGGGDEGDKGRDRVWYAVLFWMELYAMSHRPNPLILCMSAMDTSLAA